MRYYLEVFQLRMNQSQEADHKCDGLDSSQSSVNCHNLMSVKNILRTVYKQSQESPRCHLEAIESDTDQWCDGMHPSVLQK